MIQRGEFFAALREGQGIYTPNPTILRELADRKLIMLVGPSSIGKSTVMNRAIELDDRFRRVSGFTSRDQRSNDEPGMYRYIKTDEDYDKLQHDIDTGITLQYAVSPVKDVVYGTVLDDYPGKHNLQDTWYSAVDNYQRLGFKNTIIVGVVADPEDWQKWLATRFTSDDPEALSRLKEARQCLSWLLERNNVRWLHSKNGEITSAAERLIAISMGGEDSENGDSIARTMLSSIGNLEELYSGNTSILA